jgi:hypothetical protein
MKRAFAGDKNDAAPVSFSHPGKISATQPHARHHVDIEQSLPFRVGNLFERFRLENAEIVDQDVDLRQTTEEVLATGWTGEVFGDAVTCALDTSSRMRLTASHTRFSVQPLTNTRAPSRASSRASFKPAPTPVA